MINSKQHHIYMKDYSACRIGNRTSTFHDSLGNTLEIDSETLYCMFRVMMSHLSMYNQWGEFETDLIEKFPSMEGKILIE